MQKHRRGLDVAGQAEPDDEGVVRSDVVRRVVILADHTDNRHRWLFTLAWQTDPELFMGGLFALL